MHVVRLQDIEGMRFENDRCTRVMTGDDMLPAGSFSQGYVVIPPSAKVPRLAHLEEEVYPMLSSSGEITVVRKTGRSRVSRSSVFHRTCQFASRYRRRRRAHGVRLCTGERGRPSVAAVRWSPETATR